MLDTERQFTEWGFSQAPQRWFLGLSIEDSPRREPGKTELYTGGPLTQDHVV